MSDDVKHSRLRTLAKWFLVRLPIAFMLAGLLMFGALKLAEDYTDPLKEGLEQFLSDKLRAKATIGVLEKMTFVPDLQIDLRNITIHESTNVALVDMSVEKAQVSIPFSGMFFGTHRLNDIVVENLSAKAGVLMPRALKIDDMGIVSMEGPDQYGSFLRAKGFYGDEKMIFEAKLEETEAGEYLINDNIPLSIKIGDQEVSAQLDRDFSKVWLKTLVYKKEDQQSIAKDYLLGKSGAYDYANPMSCVLGFGDIEDCSVYLTTESTL